MTETSNRKSPRLVAIVLIASGVSLATNSCKKHGESASHGAGPDPSIVASSVAPKPPASPVAAAPAREAFPLSDDEVRKIVNPSGATEYGGPTATLEGVVKVIGDPPTVATFQKMPEGCDDAADSFAPSYRAGPKGELADVLVAVIGVQGFVRPSREDRVVTIRHCAIEPRVIDIDLGQRLLVANEDTMPFMPQTQARTSVMRIAIKGQSPVPLMLTSPGAYAMTWLAGAPPGAAVPTEMVFVLPSTLHSVTTIDGKFRIPGIPAGKAKVTIAHLGMKDVVTDIELKPGEVRQITLTMTYKKPAPVPPAPTASVHRPLVE